MTHPDASPDDLTRIPGLFRRWELSDVLGTCTSYRLESAGSDAHGTPLLAVYAGPTTASAVPTMDSAEAAPRQRCIARGLPLPARPPGTADAALMLTQSDLARRWRKSGRTLERWRVTGVGPEYLRLHGRVLYRLDAVLAFEEACRRRSTSDTTPAGGRR